MDDDAKYQAWRSSLPEHLRYEGDYDLRGFWRENPGFTAKEGEHLTDRFKLPNHPTFSNESKYYNAQTQHLGGRWSNEPDGSFTFTPNDPKFKKRIRESANGDPIEEPAKPRMKVREAMQQMRDAGLSEQDIFDAISRNPEAMARFKAEETGAPAGPKYEKKQIEHQPTFGEAASQDLENISNVVGRVGNSLVPGGYYNKAVQAMGGDTSGQDTLPGVTKVVADAAGGYFNPVNRVSGAIGQTLTSRLAVNLPTAQGFGQGVARALGNTGAAAAGAATAGASSQAVQEGLRGWQEGAGKRILGSGVVGGALGAGGSIIGQAGEGLQHTKGVRAREYARMGEEEAKRIVAAGPPPAGSTEGLRLYAEAEDILRMPQGGKAARFGMDAASEAANPQVKPAYEAADAKAAAARAEFTKTQQLADEVAASSARGVRARHGQNYAAERNRVYQNAGSAADDVQQRWTDEAVAPKARQAAANLRGVQAQRDAAVAESARANLVDARPLFAELNGGGHFRAPAADSALNPIGNRLKEYVVPGPNGEMFVPADELRRAQLALSDKGAWASLPGVGRSDVAPADAIARNLNARMYGEANALKARQEIGRERMRADMGLADEPGLAREAVDARKLQSYMQPALHGHHLGWNVTSNLQALSGMGPVQGAARLMERGGNALAAPRVDAAAAQTLQQWIAGADQQRKASMIGTIFSKQKESQDGVRQQDSDAPGP